MQIRYSNLILGCDPEFFIRRNGKVVGSESVLDDSMKSEHGEIIVDGVQAEINPTPSGCRQMLFKNIYLCLVSFYARAEATGHTADFSQLVEIEKEEFDQLSDSCKKFGCKPSFNLDKTLPEVMELDAYKYPFRGGAGHIHLGAIEGDIELRGTLQNVDTMVKLLDIIVGNTCVLLDRSEGNIERRKHYGRAGEYRLPVYGLEYRTISNFWLRSPILASIVFGLARQAVDIALSGKADTFFSLVDYQTVRKAIDNNDFDIAMSNFEAIKEALLQVSDTSYDTRYPLTRANIGGFGMLVADGVDKYFSTDILANWSNYRAGANDYLFDLLNLSNQ